MSKLYLGNLSTFVTQEEVEKFFQHHSLVFSAVLLKRGGYAFVEFQEQSLADRAIDKLAGLTFMGSPIIVEPSVASNQKKRMVSRTDVREDAKSLKDDGGGVNKVVVSNLPAHVTNNEIESLLSPYHYFSWDKINSRDPNYQAIAVSCESFDQAQHIANDLNGYEYEGFVLKTDLMRGGSGDEKRRGGRQRGAGFPVGAGGGGGAPGARQTDFPLRILVQSDMVGAIIGRQGSTIRQITQQSRARVDVHRKDNVGSLEKAITIYGNPENCTNACKKILEVMKHEATTNNKGEITLKILAHNNLIGRIIGKGGATIKRIMQDTDTKITVSSINDISSFNLERIITVKGTTDNMSKAESLISAKLRQSYENDLQAMAPQSLMFPGLHPMAMMATSGIGYGGRGGTYQGGLYSGAYPPVYQPMPPSSHAPDVQETTYLYIPNSAVGAIIGTKGSHIRNLIRFSGASVKISQLQMEKPDRDSQQPERRVTIVGSPESQWKAQYLIFEKMRDEGFLSGTDDVRLTVEILVPSTQVGRIIGKGGQNVRELQRVTGSIIKLPEHGAASTHEDETTVHIIGAFFSVQSAQRRIRAMVSTGGPPGAAGVPPPGVRSTHRGSSSAEASQGPPQQQPPSQQPQPSPQQAPQSQPAAQPQQQQQPQQTTQQQQPQQSPSQPVQQQPQQQSGQQ